MNAPVVERRKAPDPRYHLRRLLLDWHNGATLVIAFMAASLLIFAITFARDRANAIESSRQALKVAENKDARIDKLNAQIRRLVDEQQALVTANAEANAQSRADRARMEAEILALQEQIRQLGGKPVVPVSTTTTTRPTSTTTGPAQTTTTTRPPTTTTTTRLVCIANICPLRQNGQENKDE